MKLNSKEVTSKIISKTLVFILVVLLVVIFKSIFGEENSLIGVTSIVLTLVLLERDLTGNYLTNLTALICFNLILGVGSFIAWQNIWIGLVINFAIMFAIGYFFSYELRNPINMLVGLHYLLIMTSNITADQLPKRLVALVFGAIMIMVVQLLANKNKLENRSNKLLNQIENNISTKMNLLENKESLADINLAIDDDINELKITIYDSGKKEFHVTRYGESVINILFSLEKINILLDDLKSEDIDSEMIGHLQNAFNYIKLGTFNENSIEKINNYKHNKTKIFNIDNYIVAFKMLEKQHKKLKNIKNEEKNLIDAEEEIIDGFGDINYLNKKICLASNGVAYGIRLGALVAITVFITNFFALEYGNWMVYTVFALTQPHAEYTKIKSKKRVYGTLIGSVIVFILFNLVEDPSMRALILLAAGYLMSYVSDYKNLVIFITMASICSAAINAVNPNYIIMNRLIFVAIGVVIALLANKWLLHRNYNNEVETINNMEKEIYTRINNEALSNNSRNKNTIENLYLIQGLLENRVKILSLDVSGNYLRKNKVLINNSYYSYLLNGKE